MNKNVNIIAFGQIAEITGRELQLEAADLTELRSKLIEKYPSLVEKKFAMAVNKKLTSVNTALTENDVVALMPPYSGG